MAIAAAAPTAGAPPQDPFLQAFLDSGMEAPTVPDAANAEEEFVVFLKAAAEIEQALMVQYLYAYFTSGVDIFRYVAVQEMGHLFSVQNLLCAFGKSVHLQLPDPALPSAENTFPFPLQLAKASISTLAQYVTAESPLPGTLPEPLRTQAMQAAQDAAIDVRHVGLLFLKLYWLTQPAKAAFGPWHPPLSENWEQVFGARHLAISSLQTAGQRSWRNSWNIFMDSSSFLADSAAKTLFVGQITGVGITPAEQVCRLFYAIGAQGEGYVDDPNVQSHFERFLALYLSWKANGEPAIVNAVTNPWVGVTSSDPEIEASRITHPEAEVLAHAFNLRYERILLLIALTFTTQANTPSLITTIRTQAVTNEMHGDGINVEGNLVRFATAILSRPAKLGGASTDPKAGPPFQSPPIPADFAAIRARLVAVKAACDQLQLPAGIAPVDTSVDQALNDLLAPL